jgi:hypothetical protein
MKEIISHVAGILKNYNIPFNENELSRYSRSRLLLEAPGPVRLQEIFKQMYHKNIRINDANELEILLLTYQYISKNK